LGTRIKLKVSTRPLPKKVECIKKPKPSKKPKK
jgi:hypothetical protein